MLKIVCNKPNQLLLKVCVNYVSTNVTVNSNNLTTLKCDDNKQIAVLDMHSVPANVFKWDFMGHLKSQFELIEKNFSGLIVTSSLNCFASGADLKEFYSRERVYDYIKTFEETCLALYCLPIPTIAAINGDAFAGGIVFANACDYRYIVKGSRIGLNESMIGTTMPYFVLEWAKQILGSREGTRVALEGKFHSSEEALRINWVDMCADSEIELMKLSYDKMQQLIKIPANAYSGIKKASKSEFLINNDKHGHELRELFTNSVHTNKTNDNIGNILKSISKKK